jgi:hypothetical protein
MIIDSSNIALSAQHQAWQRRQQHESLQLFAVDQQGQRVASVELSRESSQQSLAIQAQTLATDVDRQDPNLRQQLIDSETLAPPTQPRAAFSPHEAMPTPKPASESSVPGLTLEPRTQLIKSILERMLGRTIQVGVDTSPKTEAQSAAPQSASEPQSQSQQTAKEIGSTQLGLLYQRNDRTETFEQTEFQAQGKVRTKDGLEIDFSLQLSMSHYRFEQQSVLIEAGAKLKDPLVINFDGRSAELLNNRFSFDIDADGQQDQIHALASHSGMLALDKNNDGRINDGRELFGALSGDGFSDLAHYDQDHNGFIDEADSVFSQLRVWVKDDQGNDQLLGLQELSIGALYLGSTATPFDLRGSDNELQGRIRASGVYLSENGQAGSLQQLDLVT